MGHKPAETIKQARRKVEIALMKTCGPEIQRTCEAFSYDTGLSIVDVDFYFRDITCLGDDFPKTVLDRVIVHHNDA